MKTTRFFAAAIALLSILSCQKEEQQVINNSENEGGVIITCTFAMNDAATKTTTTDGKTPLWAAGDKIMLYDGSSNIQELTLAASVTASSTQGVIDGTDATKFTFVKPSGWTNVYAIYPSSACASGFSASAPKINFASQDGTFAKANICAAAEVSGTMSFKNVGAILKFTSKSVKAAKVAVPVAGLANNFTVSFSEANPSLVSESASNSNEFSIGEGSGAIYIGVPAGEIAASSVFTYKTSADATLGTYTTGAANTVEANKIYNLGAMMGTLSGLFTVDGSGNKVQFSKGNLWCNTSISPVTYSFEANQYDYRHYNGKTSDAAVIGGSSTTTPANTVGSFFWSKDASVAYASDYSDGSAAETDKFFTNDQTTETNPNSSLTVNGSTGLWRALSSAEWTYLLNTDGSSGRTDANRFAMAKVSGVPGLIIFPDGYTGTTSGDGIAAVNTKNAAFPTSSIASATWTSMESAGCVFLPAAGYRGVSDVIEVGLYGLYWSSTPNGSDKAYDLNFLSKNVIPADNSDRNYGFSVRLVYSAAPSAPVYPEAPGLACVKIGDVWWAPVNCGYDASHTYGLLYQWGRAYGQGYNGETPAVSKQQSQLTTVAAGSEASNKDNFYYGAGVWTSASTSGTDDWFTTYNPCPAGWRVPTYDELNALLGGNESPSVTTVGGQNGCYFNGTSSASSGVFLPAAGYRDSSSGDASSRGDYCGYWSSSVNGNYAKYLTFNFGMAYLSINLRATGYSVRCVQE